MKTWVSGFLMVLVLILVPVDAQARQSVLVEITTVDGESYVGEIVDETAEIVRLRTVSGTMVEVSLDRIKRRRIVDGGPFMGSRLFFGPTARAVSDGAVYVAWQELFFLWGAIGLDRGITAAGGVSLVPGISQQLVYLAPKWTVAERENLSFATGALAAFVTGESGTAGMFYGAVTKGTPDLAVTAGMGFAYSNDGVYSQPAIMLGFEYRLTRSTRLLSENYVVPGEEGFHFIGGRIERRRMAIDIAGVTATSVLGDADGWPFIPWVSLAWKIR